MSGIGSRWDLGEFMASGVFHESMPSNIRISWAVIWTIVIARVIHLRMEAARKPVNGESVHNERVESPEQRN